MAFFFAVLAAPLFLATKEVLAADEAALAAAAACGYTPGSTIEVRRSIELPHHCVLRRVRFVIAASHVTLDCDHAVLHGLLLQDRPNPSGQAYPANDTPRDVAFLIANREGEEPLHDITIRNCTVKNYRDGADVMLQLNERTKRDLRETGNPAPIEDRLRLHAPRNITFENVTIDFAHKSGLFINRYVSHLVFRHGAVTNSGNAGIYLNSGATRNEISDSLFAANGYYDYSDTERVRSAKGQATFREAIAVDSSSRNVIRGNRFRRNAAGGVFLYKNCWEHWQDAEQLPRNMHSSDNLIEGNRFQQEPVGVWIASRQTRDLAGFGCGDRPVHEERGWFRVRRYYRDYAERTEVRANRFENVVSGIRVDADAARLVDNQFFGAATENIIIGRGIGDVTRGTRVRGTLARGNAFHSAPPRITPRTGSTAAVSE